MGDRASSVNTELTSNPHSPIMLAMKKESDPTVRSTISLRASMWEEIKAYCDREGIVTLADGVRRLLSDALRAARKKGSRDA